MPPSNSGLVEITYDHEALTLVDIKEHAAYHSTVKADGSVVLAYADLETLDTLATLTFAAKATDDTVVHITTKQLNDQKHTYDEALTIRFAHTNTEIRDVKESHLSGRWLHRRCLLPGLRQAGEEG